MQQHGESRNSHLFFSKSRTCITMLANSVRMQPLPPGTPKYTDPIEFQPGLEVGVDPYASAHTGWPDATRPVWGLSSEQILQPIEKRKILGLSVGVFWGMIVLLAVLLGGGIGGGIGAGLALKKSTCLRYSTL